MTSISLQDYERLHNQLKSTPKHQMHRFCRERGFHSWLNNAHAHQKYGQHQGALNDLS